ncbi:MAG: SsrA-binding protein SmpB [Anaerolineales bacterium]
MKNSGQKIVARNRKASHDYFLEDFAEAGIVLLGTEIKSIRAGQVSLKEAYVRLDGQEAFLVNAHIAPYNPASHFNHDPRRPRKLLLHKREIRRMHEKVSQRGYTIVPTKMYLSKGRAKVEIATARGKRQYDKRKEIAKREIDREIERGLALRRKQ